VSPVDVHPNPDRNQARRDVGPDKLTQIISRQITFSKQAKVLILKQEFCILFSFPYNRPLDRKVKGQSDMSTATAQESKSVLSSDTTYFILRRLHSLTGIIFGLYIVVHLTVNATLLEGSRHDGSPTVFQVQVDQIHRLPFLVLIEWVFIYLPILYHIVFGVYIMIKGKPNVGSYPYGKNWLYLLQRVSAIILVGFIGFHVLTMKGVFGGELGKELTFVPVDHATQSTINHMHAAWWVWAVIYPLGILAGTFHLANGFWTAAITWGLTVSKSAQRRWGFVCIGIFLFTTTLAVGAMVGAMRGEPRPIVEQTTYEDGYKSVLPTPNDAIRATENVIKGEDKPLPNK